MTRQIKVLLMILLMNLVSIGVKAQCAMCRASVENSISENSQSFAASLNAGILYLFVMPYLLVGLIIWLWFRGRQKKENSYSIRIRQGK